MSFEFKVADQSSAEAGRHQIRVAEREMPAVAGLEKPDHYGD